MLNPQIENDIRGLQMSLDILRLDYNQISMLVPGAFQHFRKINKTYLDGNPLTVIQVLHFSWELQSTELHSLSFSGRSVQGL